MRKKLKIVLDTNIFVSALIGSKMCSFIISSLEEDEFTLVLSKSTLEELSLVLKSKIFGEISIEYIETLLSLLSCKALLTKAAKSIKVCRDPKDDKILEAAVSAKADGIVTGDKDLLVLSPFKGIEILTPKAFLALLRKA